MHIFRNPPSPLLQLSEEGRQLQVRVGFVYDPSLPALPPDTARLTAVRTRGDLYYVHRQLEAEAEWLSQLTQLSLKGVKQGQYAAQGERAYRFLLQHLPTLEKQGWSVSGAERLRHFRRDAPGVDLEGVLTCQTRGQERPQLSLRMNLVSGQEQVSLQRVRTAILEGERLLPLESGRYVCISEPMQQALQAVLTTTGMRAGGVLQLDVAGLPWLQALLGSFGRLEQQLPPALLEQFAQLDARLKLPTPSRLRGVLRPYQQQGLFWLKALRDAQAGGVLADEMGLGKTLQVLALLALELDEGPTLPTLVVAPTSVVENWEQEARHFVPDLPVFQMRGDPEQRRRLPLDQPGLLITSYALLLRDIGWLQRFTFHRVVLDEAQRIKNADSRTAQAARSLRAHQRLTLSGTPIENRLEELWSQFDFLMPELLGPRERFRQRYSIPIEQEGSAQRREELKLRLGPFFLRRLKQEVAQELPPKTEILHFCELSPAQQALYRVLIGEAHEKLLPQVEKSGLVAMRGAVLVLLLRLRQICCDPGLLRHASGLSSAAQEALRQWELSGERASKRVLLEERLEEVLAGGHRTLIYSQFVRMLERLREGLDQQGIAYEYLDGSTSDRLERVNRFNAGTTPVFLLSLRAGGTGLNLTGADYVMHFDPWWNPAVEQQATDRVHRLGQQRPVFSYRFLTKGTIEERILTLQSQKQTLANDILSVDRSILSRLSLEELRWLLSPLERG
ncbi:MAG: DEAD/DEAH box helicase [Myxococcota bacterium]